MKTANLLLTSGMIDYVGSDVHHKQHINAFYSKLLIKDSLTLVEAINNNHSFNF
jgi:hypothetical protein